MKYLKQFLIIIGISFGGEILHRLIPLPIPASIYGMILLFAGLCTGLVPLESVKDTGKFLIEIMPVMFIPATASLIDSWDILKGNWLSYLVITFATTVIVMVCTGKVTQALIKPEGGQKK